VARLILIFAILLKTVVISAYRLSFAPILSQFSNALLS
jgi:hypothetical protein